MANRCAALHEAVPQSLRQQELVCLTAGHVNCPRYLRGAAGRGRGAGPRRPVSAALTPAISVALVILVLSFGASVGFVVANGGLTLPIGQRSRPIGSPSSTAAAVAPTASPPVAATPRASVAVSPTARVTDAAPDVRRSSHAAARRPWPTPKPASTPKPKPSSSRYALLKPCPSKPDCWIYTIRSGDNLFSIANYFGVPLERVTSTEPLDAHRASPGRPRAAASRRRRADLA